MRKARLLDKRRRILIASRRYILHLVFFSPPFQNTYIRHSTAGLVPPSIKITVIITINIYNNNTKMRRGRIPHSTLARKGISYATSLLFITGWLRLCLTLAGARQWEITIPPFFSPFPSASPFSSSLRSCVPGFSCSLERKLYCARTRARSWGKTLACAKIRRTLPSPLTTLRKKAEIYSGEREWRGRRGRNGENWRERERSKAAIAERKRWAIGRYRSARLAVRDPFMVRRSIKLRAYRWRLNI